MTHLGNYNNTFHLVHAHPHPPPPPLTDTSWENGRMEWENPHVFVQEKAGHR